MCHLGSMGATAGGGRLLYLDSLAEIKSGLNLQALERSPLMTSASLLPSLHDETIMKRQREPILHSYELLFFFLWFLRNLVFLASDNNHKLISTLDLHTNKAAVFISP